jgi:hypothetical protein
MARRFRTSGESAEGMTFSATMRPTAVRIAKKVEFYRLPRPVQDRFAAATKRTAPPAPLLFKPAPRTTVWAYLGGSLVVALVAAGVLRMGWGQVDSPLALHGLKMVVVDVLLWAVAAYGVVHAMSLLRALDVLPYKAGTYLFPGCLVEALGPTLRVWAVGDAESVELVTAPAHAIQLHMRDGSRVAVPARNLEDGQRVEKALESMRSDLARAIAEDDMHVLAELDPLHDSAMSSPIGPSEPMTYSVPAWTRFDWGVALAAGVVLGLVLAWTRNGMSDEAMFRAVAASATAPAYRQYMAQGGSHSAEVRDTLLPRLELREAEAQGTPEAVQAFAKDHASSKIGPEIEAALHRSLQGQLDKARQAGTITALDDLAKKYPDGGLEPDIKAAKHVLYAQAFADWKKKATPDAATAAFMERLLAQVEKSGQATVDVRFRLKPSKTLADADKQVTKSNHFPGPDALPSKYVTDAAMHKREQRVAGDLVKGLGAELPADVLALRAGEPLAADAPLPKDVPTLVVDYAPEWSHVNTVSTKPPTIFAGINFTFDVSFVLPEGAPLTIRTKSWRGAELWKMKGEGMERPDFEQQVYDSMFDGAFDQLSKKLTDTLL